MSKQTIIRQSKKAGEQYASDQVNGAYFMDWVHDQLYEASRMDPEDVLPLETKADARRAARNMLQQLEWDAKRDLSSREIYELTGARVEPVRNVEAAFFEGFQRVTRADSTIDWLADEILEINRGLRAPSRKDREARTARYPEPPRGPTHIVTPRSRARARRGFR